MEKKSMNNVIVAVVAALLVVAVAIGAWKFLLAPSDEPTSESASTSEMRGDDELTDEEVEAVVTDGTISGSLTYPSEGIPDNLEVHAYNIDTETDYITKDHVLGSEFVYEVGYRITVPAGRYHVYATVPGMSQKAYHNEYVKCGMAQGCTDTSVVEIVVEAGKETSTVMVGDWYNQ